MYVAETIVHYKISNHLTPKIKNIFMTLAEGKLNRM